MRLWPRRVNAPETVSGASIRRWLIALSIGYIVLILAVVWFADSSKRQATTNMARLTELSEQQHAVTQLILDVSELERSALVFRLTADAAETPRTDRLYTRIVERQSNLHSRIANGPARDILHRLGRHIKDFNTNFTILVENRQVAPTLEDASFLANKKYIAVLLSEMAEAVDQIQLLADRLVELGDADLIEARAAAESQIKQALRNDLAVLVIAVIFAFILIWAMARWLTRMARVEAGLQKSEARFRSTFDQAAVGIAHISFSGEWLRMNQKVCDILGYPMNELAALTFQDVTHPEDLQKDLQYVEQMLAGEITTYDMEKRYYRKSGDIVWINLTVSLVREEGGEAGYFVSVIEDIDRRKEADERLSQALTELAYSNQELQQFAYVASHDLQEPLRMVVSFLGLIESEYADKLDDSGREYIHYAVDGGRRMKALIQGLLEYSRIQGQGKAIASVDTEAVLDDALANLKLAIEDAEAQITREALPTVHADADQLLRLFQNLLGNAIKFKGSMAPHIHISCREAGEMPGCPEGVESSDHLFCVEDNGLGFQRDEQAQVFKMFKRLHTQTEHPGSGIGLAICQRIVERHGGKIWASSEPGKGAKFFFTFPNKNG